jgi:hypothetical protein
MGVALFSQLPPLEGAKPANVSASSNASISPGVSVDAPATRLRANEPWLAVENFGLDIAPPTLPRRIYRRALIGAITRKSKQCLASGRSRDPKGVSV